MRILSTVFAILILLPLAGCDQPSSMEVMDRTANEIFDGKIKTDKNGACVIDEANNVIGNVAFVTNGEDGSKMILFRTWQGKGSNMRGFLYTDAEPLKVGSQIELVTYTPSADATGLPVGKLDVSIASEISKTCYSVYFALD